MRRRIALLAGVAALVGAPAAQARTATVGSSLKAPATVAQTHPVDSAFWPAKRAHGPSIRVPFKGQAVRIRMKGGIVKHGGAKPFDRVAFQVLRRVGHVWRVVVTSESFNAPVLRHPNQIETYRSKFLCVRKGDRIALSNSGGFGNGYPNGVPFQTFASVPGAITNAFTGAGKDNNDNLLRGMLLADTELLVQSKIVSGSKARPACR